MTLALLGKYHGPQRAKKKIKRYSIFLATEAAILLWVVMVVDIDHPHTHSGKYVLYVKNVGTRGLYLNIEGLFFLSNQGCHLALV